MTFHTALTRKLGIEHPILLAPMGGASGGTLAAAVSGAGGLGMVGRAYGDPEVLEREFAAWQATPGLGAVLSHGRWRAGLRPSIKRSATRHRRSVDWPTHYTGRALANAFGRRWHNREQLLEAEVHTERARYAEAAAAGDFDTAVVYTGEAIDMIHSIEPAAAILHRVIAEAEAALARRFD